MTGGFGTLGGFEKPLFYRCYLAHERVLMSTRLSSTINRHREVLVGG